MPSIAPQRRCIAATGVDAPARACTPCYAAAERHFLSRHKCIYLEKKDKWMSIDTAIGDEASFFLMSKGFH